MNSDHMRLSDHMLNVCSNSYSVDLFADEKPQIYCGKTG